MLKDLIIREEKQEDYKKTELMAMRSFWNNFILQPILALNNMNAISFLAD